MPSDPVFALPDGWPAMSVAEADAVLTAPGAPFEMEEKLIRGRRVRVWKTGPQTLVEVIRAGRAHGGKTFLVYEDERVTFDAFHRAVAALAQELAAQGVAKGDRVAVAMRNLPEWPVAFYAAVALGAIVTPLNAWWTGPELAFGLQDSGASVAILDAERLERLAPHLAQTPALRKVYASRLAAPHPGVTALEQVIGPSAAWSGLPDAELPQVDVRPDDDATLFYSSGTTGRPKGVLATHRGINTNINTAGIVGARGFLRRGIKPPAPNPDAPQRGILLAVPLFHVSGCFSSLNPNLYRGGKLVMMRRFETRRAFELIEAERLAQAGGVPALAWRLVEDFRPGEYDLSSMELIVYGGAPCPPELTRRVMEIFPNCLPGTGWGMTETTSAVTSHNGPDCLAKPASCGPLTPIADMKVISPDGARELPLGEAGELWCYGPQVSPGYWNRPEADAQSFADGWLRTGDIGKVDADGFWYIVDRIKDVLIRGGENIYCSEVENALFEHPGVLEAAVVARPHRTLGEEPAAVIVRKPGSTVSAEELAAFLADRLAAFKVPVAFAFRDEPLPLNASGKVLKTELRPLFANDQ
jgi:long-chain acyl-CoA synthetase